MPSSKNRLVWAVQGFAGGLATNAPSFAIEGDQSPDAENFDPSVRYKLKKRGGTSNFTGDHGAPTSSLYVTGLYMSALENGTALMVAKEGTAVYDISAGNWSTTISGHPALSDADEVHFRIFRNTLIMVSEESSPIAPQKWSGSGSFSNLGGSPPSAKFIEVHRNRLWLASTNADPSRIYFSAVNDHEDWTTADNAGNFYVGRGDGMVINGIISDGEILYVSKKAPGSTTEGALYVVLGDNPTNFVIRRIAWFGATSQRAMITTASYCAAVTPQGVFALQGTRLILLSVAVNDVITGLSTAQLSACALGRYKNQLWVAYPASGSTNSKALVFDQVYQVWSRYNPCTMRFFTTHPDGSLYGGSSTTTIRVAKFNTGTSDIGSAAITMYWFTPNLDFGAWYLDKWWIQSYFHIPVDTNNWTITHLIDDTASSDSVTVDADADTNPVKNIGGLGADPSGRFFKFKINESSTNASECYAFQIEAEASPGDK